MRVLIVSSSLNPQSRSDRLAVLARAWLADHGHEATLIRLADLGLPRLNPDAVYDHPGYRAAAALVASADNLILASPVYNWSPCAEMKNFIELVGCTDARHPTPLFDKLVSFIFAAGLPHSYMAIGSLALPLMLDFRCLINPHQAYLHNRHWEDPDTLTDKGHDKLNRMLSTHVDLGTRLQTFSVTQQWEV